MISNQTRQLAAIMFVDIQGFTKRMGENEQLANSMRTKLEEGLGRFIAPNNGKIIKKMGDGALCLFNSDIQAVSAAIALQLFMRSEPLVPVRIGIHAGDVVIDKHDVYGDGVNIASRVESFAVAGGILLSGKVYDEIRNQPDIKTAYLGKFGFTNVAQPVDVYAISNEGIIVPDVKKMDGKGITYYKKRSNNARMLAIAALLLTAIGFTLYKTIMHGGLSGKKNSVVVMPFKNMSTTKDNDFFSDGITEDILTQISKISGLSVLSQSTSMQLKNTAKTVMELGQELNVNYILEGSVRRENDQVRISAQLVDASTGQNIWADTYDRESSKIFEIQSEIAKFIANVLKKKLSSAEQESINKKPTSNVTAYEHYLRGRDHYYQYSKNENDLAINEFKTAIGLDEKYSLAWAGLADAYSQKIILGFPATWLDSGRIASQKAIGLDTTSSEAYKALANYYLYKADYYRAKPLLLKSIALNPNNAPAIGNLGSCYFLTGQLDEALKWEKKSAVLEPTKFVPFYIVGWIYRLLGNNQMAEQWLKKSLELKAHPDTYYQLAFTYLAAGKTREARSIVPRLIALDTASADNYQSAGLISQLAGDNSISPVYFKKAIGLQPDAGTNPDFFATIGLAYDMQKSGKQVDAEIILTRAISVFPDSTIPAANNYDRYVFAAAAFAMEGRADRSVYYLNKAANAHWIDHFFAEKNPWFENVQQDPGFKTLMQQLKTRASNFKMAAANQ